MPICIVEVAKLGIDVAGESQLVGYPTQFPSVSMMDWANGKPNARFWVLKLLKDNFGPGDKLVETDAQHNRDVDVQGFATANGHKLLLINKRDRPVNITLSNEAANARVPRVDETTGENPPESSTSSGNSIVLAPFSVSVVTMP